MARPPVARAQMAHMACLPRDSEKTCHRMAVSDKFAGVLLYAQSAAAIFWREQMRYASICAIVKNEDISLREWILYHFAIGFEHITLYDNGDPASAGAVVRDFVENGLVAVIDFPIRHNQQMQAYAECLRNAASASRWLAFIDVDEFVVMRRHKDIKDFLDQYDKFGGVCMHWKMFGSNGHISRPKGRVIGSYTQSLSLSSLFKSIVRTDRAIAPLSPHHFAFRDNFYCVNEDCIPVLSSQSYPLANLIQLNHYFYKSQQDFEDKVNRGFFAGHGPSAIRQMEQFYEHLSMSGSTDKSACKFAPALDRLERAGASAIARLIAGNAPKDWISEILTIANSIPGGDMAGVKRRLALVKRYYDNLEIQLAEAMLAVAEQDIGGAHAIIARLLLQNAGDAMKCGTIYAQLEHIYKMRGLHDTAAAIHALITS